MDMMNHENLKRGTSEVLDILIRRSPAKAPVVIYDEMYEGIIAGLKARGYNYCITEMPLGRYLELTYFITSLANEKPYRITEIGEFHHLSDAVKALHKLIHYRALSGIGTHSWERDYPDFDTDRMKQEFPINYSYGMATRLLYMAINDIIPNGHYGDADCALWSEMKRILDHCHLTDT